jgi:catechol 2,3-dioxygenase-like lactoylglutathione lyase family enzyme
MAGETYVVLEQSAALIGGSHDRLRPGLNHLAFYAGSKGRVSELAGETQRHGWNLLFADRRPFAGGAKHFAAYLEDPDGFEVELVASE